MRGLRISFQQMHSHPITDRKVVNIRKNDIFSGEEIIP